MVASSSLLTAVSGWPPRIRVTLEETFSGKLRTARATRSQRNPRNVAVSARRDCISRNLPESSSISSGPLSGPSRSASPATSAASPVGGAGPARQRISRYLDITTTTYLVSHHALPAGLPSLKMTLGDIGKTRHPGWVADLLVRPGLTIPERALRWRFARSSG